VTQDDLALRITGLRPGETPFLQPLGADLLSTRFAHSALDCSSMGISGSAAFQRLRTSLYGAKSPY
jgi:hypothetical protein